MHNTDFYRNLWNVSFLTHLWQVNTGTKCHGRSRDPGKNARPESASCCLRAAIDRRFRQPKGSMRRSRVGIFARIPRAAWHFYIITLQFRFHVRDQLTLTVLKIVFFLVLCYPQMTQENIPEKFGRNHNHCPIGLIMTVLFFIMPAL